MSNEEKKEYLNGYRNACKRIINLQEQMESLREVEQSAKIQQLSDMPKGGSRHKDLSDLLIKLEKLQDKIDDAIIESLQVKVEIEDTLLRVRDSDEARILRFRYIDFMKWEEISVKMNYSYRQVLYIHGRALANYEHEKIA